MPFGPAALALLLPSGVNRWVGLLVAAPNEVAGTFSEVADSQYVRIAHSTWASADNGDGRLARRNSGAIVFGALVDDDRVVTHWAIFDAANAGNLLAAGPVLNSDGKPQPASVPTNDQPRFNDGDIKLLSSEAT